MAHDNLIQHVSDTAYWIAAYRAKESERPDALFKDPLAAKLAGSHGKAIVENMEQLSNRKPLEWSVSIRTVIIDNYIEKAIAEGVDLILNLGAGLDTRPYRLNLPTQLLWIEADFPGIISMKEKTLQTDRPRCRLERVAVDLSNNLERKQFLSGVNSKAKKVLVLTEGVVPYLSNEDVAALAGNLSEQNHFKYWVTDYFSPLFMQLYKSGRVGKGIQQNAPFRFFPENWEEFFSSYFWNKKEMRFLSQEGEKLSRPSPMPLLFRLMKPFMPEKRKNQFRSMTGYALLENKEFSAGN